MDIGRSFTYATEDQEWWKKVLIVGLLSLIPIAGQFYLVGYALEVLKNVIGGQPTPLPQAVDNFGGRIVKGLMMGIILTIYMLPVAVIAGCAGGGGQVFLAVMEDQDLATTLMGVWSACFGCLSLLLVIPVGLAAPLIWGIYAETGNFGAAFQLGKIFGMLKSVIGPAFIVLLVAGVAGFAASLAGTLVCGIGLVFTMTYFQLVMAFLHGSLYNKAKMSVR